MGGRWGMVVGLTYVGIDGDEGLSNTSFINSRVDEIPSRVCDLWAPGTVMWDKHRIESLYGEEVGDRICNLPLLRDGLQDRIIWFHASNGCYSTKDGYSWLILHKVGLGPHRLY